jgi:hypothetical protein
MNGIGYDNTIWIIIKKGKLELAFDTQYKYIIVNL